MSSQKENNIPTSKYARGKVAGKTMVKVGLVSGKGFVKRAFMSKERHEDVKSETNEEIAKAIFDSLSELKGVSVKIAQQIALGLPFLPQEYVDEMTKTFSSIPPINRVLIRKIIKQEFGVYPNELFETFETQAFGAASLGQVHEAMYNNQRLAVKVQYPGIDKTIESDLEIINFGLKRFAKGQNVEHLMNELAERLREEVDYRLEANNTIYYANNLKHEFIVIPKIIEPLSSKKVLTSSFLEGNSFEDYIALNPSQVVRNHYAQLIFDSFFIGLYQLKMVHADPNPGNFIFMSDNKLGIIDFGCVKRVDESFLRDFSKLHLLLMDEASDDEVVEQYANLGMIDEGEKSEMITFYYKAIKPLDRIYIEIFQNETYDFKANSDFSERGFNTIMEIQKNQREALHKMNADFIFIDRTLLGYYSMFEKMEARVDTRFATKMIKSMNRT